MRNLIAAALFSTSLLACAKVLGVDFSSYREADGSASAQPPGRLECVPNEVSRCLCELREGVRTCDETGRLQPCVCGGGVGACGNGVLEEGEACDDGNQAGGDGCGLSCAPDGRHPDVEQCPGQSVVAWPGKLFSMNLVGSVRASPGSPDAGACGGGPAAPDRVFMLTMREAGMLEVTVTASVPTLVSLRTECAVAAEAPNCTRVPASQAGTVRMTVGEGQVVHLVVEPGEASPTATFDIQVVKL